MCTFLSALDEWQFVIQLALLFLYHDMDWTANGSSPSPYHGHSNITCSDIGWFSRNLHLRPRPKTTELHALHRIILSLPTHEITCFIAILTSPVAARGSRRLRYQGCLWCPPTARLERWREFEPMTRA